MSIPVSFNAKFKTWPYFYVRVFLDSIVEVARKTLPAIDWQSRFTHEAVDYPSEGMVACVPWFSTQAEWDAIIAGPGQMRVAGRQAVGIEFPTELNWTPLATPLEIARNKSDVKHQTLLCDKLPEVKQSLIALALSECPTTFVTTFQSLPVADQTMSRLMSDLRARYYAMPPDQVVLMQARMNEPWIATQDPREFTSHLKSFRDAMPPVYQAVHGDVVLVQILIDALRNHPTLQAHIREELHRTRPIDFELFPYDDAAEIWCRFVLMDNNSGVYTTTHAAVVQPPVQGPAQDPAVHSTFSELAAAVHSLQATVHAMNTTAQFQGRGGRGGYQGRGQVQGRGQGRQGRGVQGRIQGRGRGGRGNPTRMFCFWHHFDYPHTTDMCNYCTMYYPIAQFPSVYTLTRPGMVNAPGGVQLISGGGSSN